MTSRRVAKKVKSMKQDRTWWPTWLQRRNKRSDRTRANGHSLIFCHLFAEPQGMHDRFDHARVLARKASCGRKRR